MDLLPGQNTVISASQIEVRLSYTQKTTFRSDLDASAFLLGENDKTHSDEDMLFFNNNSNANKSVTMRSEQGDTFFAVDLTTLPSSVSKIALTVVIDGPDTLDGLEQLKMTVDGHTFNVSLQGRSEKALIVAHIYRHNGQFKIRAVGQGFDGGLHPLALHFGVDVASPEPAPSSAPVPASNTTVSLEKKLAKAPALVSLAKPLRVSLEKHRLSDVKAQVAFVLDASGSMTAQFKKGNVQKVLERIAALAVQFDDDGLMPVWGFAEKHKRYEDVTLDNLDGYIERIQKDGKKGMWEILPGLGGTNNEPPVLADIIREFRNSTLPVYVVFITDGGINKTREIKEKIVESSGCPIFFKFVGLGGNNYGILEKLDNLSGRPVDNTHFFPIDNYDRLSDEYLYDQLLVEFREWLDAARKEGICR